jgi:hypothetical protein
MSGFLPGPIDYFQTLFLQSEDGGDKIGIAGNLDSFTGMVLRFLSVPFNP